jgi:hypothetical protein
VKGLDETQFKFSQKTIILINSDICRQPVVVKYDQRNLGLRLTQLLQESALDRRANKSYILVNTSETVIDHKHSAQLVSRNIVLLVTVLKAQ